MDDANSEAAKISLIVLIAWIGESRMLVCSSIVDEALREIDTTVPLFVASRPLAIHISNLQCIAIFAVPRSPGSFLSVLFIANDWVLSLPGLTCPFLSVLFITNVRILSLLGLMRPIPQSFPILLLRSESLVFFGVFFRGMIASQFC